MTFAARISRERPNEIALREAGRELRGEVDDILNRRQSAMTQTDDAVRIHPDSDADHVFRVGTRIEIDPAQREKQRLTRAH